MSPESTIFSVVLLFLSLPFAGLLISNSAGDPQSGGQRTFEKAVKAGQKLFINLETGARLNISGWDKDLVSVKVDLGDNWQHSKVEVEDTPNGVEIASRHTGAQSIQSSNVRIDIQVPERFDMQIDSSGGAVNIRNVDGSVNGSTSGGNLYLTDMNGVVDLSTGGGNITLTRSNLDGKVSTGGGEVLMQDVTGNVVGYSGGGNVIHKNASSGEDKSIRNESRVDESTGKKIRISKAGGGVNIEQAPQGADVETGGGKIHIGSVQGFVKAKTGGGNVTIDAVDGSVEVTTGAGDVNVTMVGDPNSGGRDVSILVGTGNIALVVPDGLSAEFNLKLGYTDTHKPYKIMSDFNLNVESPDEWSSKEGTSRRYVYGTGSVAGGKNKIRIETVNGNIYIKKKQ